MFFSELWFRDCRYRYNNLQRSEIDTHAWDLSSLIWSGRPDCLDYGVLIGNPCRYGTFLAEEKWFVTSEGHISLEDYPIQHHNEYCMDIFYNNSTVSFDRDIYLVLCFGNPQVDQYRQIRYTNFLHSSFSFWTRCWRAFDNSAQR